MLHEKRPTKDPLPTKEPRKCKSHLFKEAYDQTRKQKLHTSAMKHP
jgi:hypothetical protein